MTTPTGGHYPGREYPSSDYPGWGAPQPAPPPPKQKKPVSRVLLLLGVFLAVLACIVGAVLIGGSNDAPTIKPSPTATKSVTSAKAVPPAKAVPKTVIKDGTWLVGKDVAAGDYKTKGARQGGIQLCSWHTAPDRTLDRIADIGAVNGVDEQGVVTLKNGMYFKTNGCQDWQRG